MVRYVLACAVSTSLLAGCSQAAKKPALKPVATTVPSTTTAVLPVPTTLPVTTTTVVPTTAPPTAPEPEPPVENPMVGTIVESVSLDDPDMDKWRQIALCEMPGPGGVPSEPWGAHWGFIGNRFSGAYGIANSTWRAFAGTEFGPTAGHATWQQQTIVARRIRDRHGYGAWGCG